jgi:hypothetical protein
LPAIGGVPPGPAGDAPHDVRRITALIEIDDVSPVA